MPPFNNNQTPRLIVLLKNHEALRETLIMTRTTATTWDGPLGALTTPFEVADFCPIIFQVTSSDGEPSEAATSLYWGDYYMTWLPTPYSTNPCYPPSFSDNIFKTYFESYRFYSPGVCPSGWTSADSSRSDRNYRGLPTKSGEYAALCCPRCVLFRVPFIVLFTELHAKTSPSEQRLQT